MALYDPQEELGASLRETGSCPSGQAPAGLVAPRIDPARDFTLNETERTLLAAKALIERGWYQGGFEGDGGVCSIGAINKASTGDVYKMGPGDPYAALINAIGSDSILRWNDAPERTQAEVIEAFGRAAEIARNGATSL